jgi:hypothetical protein
MKSFYKQWFADVNKKARPKFKSPPTLTEAKMKLIIELSLRSKMPMLLELMEAR